MIDSSKTPGSDIPELERNQLLGRIDELEKLLAKKKAESQQSQTPRLKVGTDGIPVLVETVSADNNVDQSESLATLSNDDILNDIIDKVDKEITQDLDELIVMLKDSIIDEVKTRLLQELKLKKNK